MPLYEYRCRACENVFEYIQGLSEGPKRKCEECGGRLEKLVSRSGFVLKGSGWYETDFKGKGGKPAGGETSKDASSKSGSSKKESKSASKSDATGAGESAAKPSGGKD